MQTIIFIILFILYTIVLADDIDNDGVEDFNDYCLDTLPNIIVDKYGCFIYISNSLLEKEEDQNNSSKISLFLDLNITNKIDINTTIVDKQTLKKEPLSSLSSYDIVFQYKSVIININSYNKLKEYALFLKENSKFKILIDVYTDNIGNAFYNKKLSQIRANIIKKILIKEGINSKDIIALGRGEKNAIETNLSKEGRQKNRRIEIKIIKKERDYIENR